MYAPPFVCALSVFCNQIILP